MDANSALTAFCADALNAYKLVDDEGKPVPRSLRIRCTAGNRKVRASGIPMVDGSGQALTAEQLAASVLARAGEFLAAGEDLVLELMRRNDSNPSDQIPLSLPSSSTAIARRSPLEVFRLASGGTEESIILSA